MGKMTDMKEPKAKKEINPPGLIGGSPYSYRHEVTLNHDDMEKLGIAKMPKVGDKLHLHSEATVTHARHEERIKGSPTREIRLQMKKMAVKKPQADSMEEALDQGVDEADA